MNEQTPVLSPDDPRLTAYALGELADADFAAVDVAVRNDPALQAVVAEIQALGGELAATLANEPMSGELLAPAEEAEQVAHSTGGVAGSPAPSADGGEFEAPKRGKLLRFPGLYYVFATAAAAGFAIMVVNHSSQNFPTAKEERHYVQMTSRDERADGGAVAPAASAPAAAISLRGSAEGVAKAEPPALMTKSKRAAERVELASFGLPVNVAADLAAEAYRHTPETRFVATMEQPLSTFSVDVDTASYSNVRRFLTDGRLPPADAVRIEELLNYFPYAYAPPAATSPSTSSAAETPPFAAHLEVAASPWAPEHRLVRVALKGREVSAQARGAASLVFLLDVSGSMDAPNKLPLVKESLRMLLGRLRDDDRVAIVTYAGNSGLALPSTPVRRRAEILEALEKLEPAGSTHGSMGIQLAYDIAKANPAAAPGLTRVILCTDGDFNVGATSEGELVRLIEDKARSGVFLTVLGFGMGNYKDGTLEQLADKGNGMYGYVDTRREAEKLLVEQLSGTLVTIAKDVKIQVEFNPAQVARYRLIGYENRRLENPDFANDAVDAGEIGAGHSVTALYEVVPASAADVGEDAVPAPSLKYMKPAERREDPLISRELLTVGVRYKDPTGDVSRKLEFPLVDGGQSFEQASPDFQFAAAVAGFGMVLRDSPFRGSATYATVNAWATRGAASDPGGYRAEFVDLVRRAQQVVR